MTAKKTIILPVVAAAALVVAILVGGVVTGVLPGFQSLQTQGKPQAGTLSILMTDPPVVSAGVSAVYVTYTNVGLHNSNAGNNSGWMQFNNTGTVNLMSLVNVSQTIASAKLPNGTYNLIRLDVSSAVVTYDGSNYSASIPSGEITGSIKGGIQVNGTSAGAIIVDMQPEVINVGTSSSPEFIIRPSAQVYTVPPNDVDSNMQTTGYRLSLTGKAWWSDDQANASSSVQITVATLTNGSLNIVVKNSGQQNVNIKAIIITPLSDYESGQSTASVRNDEMPSTMSNSSILLVQSSGQLISLQSVISGSIGVDLGDKIFASVFGGSGYTLASGSTTTFAFNGTMTPGIPGLSIGTQGNLSPSSGQYVITVVSSSSVTNTVVVAG
jgi:hypothetical protein